MKLPLIDVFTLLLYLSGMLAIGVYLYQVLTRINGNAIEKRSTQADQFFVQNVGKIYLMK